MILYRPVTSLAVIALLSLAACSKEEPPKPYAVEEVPLSQIADDLAAGRTTSVAVHNSARSSSPVRVPGQADDAVRPEDGIPRTPEVDLAHVLPCARSTLAVRSRGGATSVVRDLVRGIAESGEWAETHRLEAAKVVAPYFRQDEKVIRYVLTQPPDRVSYRMLTPTDEDLQQINDMAVKAGILAKPIAMKDLIDRQFIPLDIKPANIDAGQ